MGYAGAMPKGEIRAKPFAKGVNITATAIANTLVDSWEPLTASSFRTKIEDQLKFSDQ